MCGIAGLIRFEGAGVDPAEIRPMLAAQAHRGPDGEGVLCQGLIGLGHRRLAIIDPAGGAQPFCSDDQQLWLSFNGEIYNHLSLREELTAKGHAFRTRSDTETLLHAYQEWGSGCVTRLRGMFAFAIVDHARRLLFLARDHLGIKPLLYARLGNGLAFASEFSGLLALPGVGQRLDLEAIDQFLHLQYIPAPLTIFDDIRKLPPGSTMTVSMDGRQEGPQGYWQVEFVPDPKPSYDDWTRLVDAAVQESVTAHLIADVPFGAFLSGGLDSTLVVSCMAKAMDRPVETFSIGFKEADFDESAYARAGTSERIGTHHHAEIVGEDATAGLSSMLLHLGEPFGDPSWLATQQVCALARRHVTMALSGDGGDEAFGGYDSHRSWMQWLGYEAIPSWKRPLRRALGMIGHPRWPRRSPTPANWMMFCEQLADRQRLPLWRRELKGRLSGRIEAFERAALAAAGQDPSSVARIMDLGTYLPDDILVKVDRASMMHSLEVRTPLVDIRLIELASRIPGSGWPWTGTLRADGWARDHSAPLLAREVPGQLHPSAEDGLQRSGSSDGCRLEGSAGSWAAAAI